MQNQNDDCVPLPLIFYHFGKLIFPPNSDGHTGDSKCLVAHFTGRGRIDALCYRADYYGVWFGYEIDDYPPLICHNGHCLQNMGLIGAAADGMPYYLPYFNSREDLSVASRLPVQFNHSFKLWMGNSHEELEKTCFGLHLYVTGWNIDPANGNLLDWTLVLPERHKHTMASEETIVVKKNESS